ncbi:hypothetical protein EW146_g4347 [Bondarzewia mesenterica]|uniref:Rhodopsin domain-containing protein n=1 Tax=Bondarzewia mesenterica TaxID=1095465 RepID=A0A4V3XF64_9AGAM|nr:hypothetical protein EW146_g4347 [Bondarzewia mesenterica]
MAAATVEQVRITALVLYPIAMLVTLFRLYVRFARSKLWWDDAWVLVSLLCAIVSLTATLLHIQDPPVLSRNAQVAVYYMIAQFFYAVAWSARLSILFTVIRLSFERLRRMMVIMSVGFFITWVILFAQVWWVCERQPGWKDQPFPQCILGENVAIAQIIAAVLSDAILVFSPIRLIWSVRLDKITKIRLIAVFATSAITTVVSMFHAYAILRIPGLTEALAATIEDSVSLLTANLTVVVAFLFNLKSDSDDSDNRQPLHYSFVRPRKNPMSTMGLTTTIAHPEPMVVDVHVDRIHDRPAGSQTAVDSQGGSDHVFWGKTDVSETFELKMLSSDDSKDDIKNGFNRV